MEIQVLSVMGRKSISGISEATGDVGVQGNFCPVFCINLTFFSQVRSTPDSMAQWQDCRPECWEAWGREFNSMPGR